MDEKIFPGTDDLPAKKLDRMASIARLLKEEISDSVLKDQPDMSHIRTSLDILAKVTRVDGLGFETYPEECENPHYFPGRGVARMMGAMPNENEKLMDKVFAMAEAVLHRMDQVNNPPERKAQALLDIAKRTEMHDPERANILKNKALDLVLLKDPCESIGAGVAAASTGDTVVVSPGLYAETLILNKKEGQDETLHSELLGGHQLGEPGKRHGPEGGANHPGGAGLDPAAAEEVQAARPFVRGRITGDHDPLPLGEGQHGPDEDLQR